MTASSPSALTTTPLVIAPPPAAVGGVAPLVVGPYALGVELGRGGSGVVYAAEHALLGRPAAVKLLRPAVARDPAHLRRLRHEAIVTAALRGPHVAAIYDFAIAPPGDAYLAMELLVGETLRARVARAGRLPWTTVARLGHQLAVALAAIHRAGVVHADLTPDNVFLAVDPRATGGERVTVLDFGCARVLDAGAAQAEPEVVGTPAYMAPEQAVGGAAIDVRADLYALGCVLFHALTGRAPFGGPIRWVLAAHQHLPMPLLSILVPGVPVALEALVARLLTKRAADRPVADQVAHALRALAGADVIRRPTGGRARRPRYGVSVTRIVNPP